ncbi:basic proline-rich protein-like isoform X2 [Manis pentadactyla]|uniref:basic proline-rich protein-like isoform X2 n=1 Tax=Manis pentadactyla TaxID=143292 RepID=UPI00255CA4A8|nr:basic proline-rich protein-like isoform X2 [Manis pentadactyla]
MVTGKPSHAPVRPPEGKRGQGAVSGFLWGSLTGERGPGRRYGPRHHRDGRPGRPEQPSQGATGTSGRTPCTWVHSHELLGWPVPVDRRAHTDPTACDCVTSHGKRDYEILQPGRHVGGWPQDRGLGSELQTGRRPQARAQGTGEPPDGTEACGRGSSKETPVSEGRSARRDGRWPDDSPRRMLRELGPRHEPSPGTRQSAGAGLLVQEPNGPASSRDPDLAPPQGLQAKEGSGAALARGSPLRAPPRRSPRSIPSSGSFVPPPIPGLGPRAWAAPPLLPSPSHLCSDRSPPRGPPPPKHATPPSPACCGPSPASPGTKALVGHPLCSVPPLYPLCIFSPRAT